MFIGSPQPGGNYILRQCMAWMHTHTPLNTCTNAGAPHKISSSEHTSLSCTTLCVSLDRPKKKKKKNPLADVNMQTSDLSPACLLRSACVCVRVSPHAVYVPLCLCVLPRKFLTYTQICTKVLNGSTFHLHEATSVSVQSLGAEKAASFNGKLLNS